MQNRCCIRTAPWLCESTVGTKARTKQNKGEVYLITSPLIKTLGLLPIIHSLHNSTISIYNTDFFRFSFLVRKLPSSNRLFWLRQNKWYFQIKRGYTVIYCLNSTQRLNMQVKNRCCKGTAHWMCPYLVQKPGVKLPLLKT